MARTKTPDALKSLRGTDQPCRMSNAPTGERITAVEAPKGLTGAAKSIYLEKANQLITLDMLTPLDLDAIYIYAINMELVRKAVAHLKKDGMVIWVKDEDGNICGQQLNLYHKVLNDAIKVVNQIGSQFGFTPVSRQRLMTQPKEQESDPISEFF